MEKKVPPQSKFYEEVYQNTKYIKFRIFDEIKKTTDVRKGIFEFYLFWLYVVKMDVFTKTCQCWVFVYDTLNIFGKTDPIGYKKLQIRKGNDRNI